MTVKLASDVGPGSARKRPGMVERWTTDAGISRPIAAVRHNMIMSAPTSGVVSEPDITDRAWRLSKIVWPKLDRIDTERQSSNRSYRK